MLGNIGPWSECQPEGSTSDRGCEVRNLKTSSTLWPGSKLRNANCLCASESVMFIANLCVYVVWSSWQFLGYSGREVMATVPILFGTYLERLDYVRLPPAAVRCCPPPTAACPPPPAAAARLTRLTPRGMGPCGSIWTNMDHITLHQCKLNI